MLPGHITVFSKSGLQTISRETFVIDIFYQTKICRTKLSKFWFGLENFVKRKIVFVKYFVLYVDTKVRQKSGKFVKISPWYRKICLAKCFARRNFFWLGRLFILIHTHTINVVISKHHTLPLTFILLNFFNEWRRNTPHLLLYKTN